MRLIRNSNLENIGALADLRVYLNNQETSLADILLEELHDHLYLKLPYCLDRWKAYSVDVVRSADPQSSGTGIRPLYRFLTGLNTLIPMVDDASRNPEMDSFEYIHMLMEALNKMGRLDQAVDRMEQRLPVELFAVVERTTQEVDLRHPAHLRSSKKSKLVGPFVRVTGADDRGEVLHDLLYTLYSKFEAIAEGHRAAHEIIAGIVHREGTGNPSTLLGGFKELWKLYQSEMRSLLHDYLATDGNPLYSARNISAMDTNVFQRNHRDKSKKVFKLGELNKKSPELANEQEELDKILQASVPGLVSKSQRRSVVTPGDRSVTYDGPAAGHKLLIEPSVFNISLLLPPSLSFLQRLKDIVPPDSDIAISTLTSFLDDFLVNVFNPQLDDTVTELCTRSFIELDAFVQDPHWADHARRPIFKVNTCLLVWLSLLTLSLRGPRFSLRSSRTSAKCLIIFHRIKHLPSSSSRNLLRTMTSVRGTTKVGLICITMYIMLTCEALVTRSHAENGVHFKRAASLIENGDLAVVVKTIWQGDESDRERLMQKVDLISLPIISYADVPKEVELLISNTNETPLEPFDIVSDRRTVTALCLLYSSMVSHMWRVCLEYMLIVHQQWLASRLSQLRRVLDQESTSVQDTQIGRQSQRWTIVSAANMQDNDQPVNLPLTKASVECV